jgi:hypothetical protein
MLDGLERVLDLVAEVYCHLAHSFRWTCIGLGYHCFDRRMAGTVAEAADPVA